MVHPLQLAAQPLHLEMSSDHVIESDDYSSLAPDRIRCNVYVCMMQMIINISHVSHELTLLIRCELIDAWPAAVIAQLVTLSGTYR